MSFSSDVKEYARSLGYDLVGFTTADTFPLYKEELQSRQEMYSWATGSDWGLVQGADPKNALSEARSVVVVAFDYYKHSYPPEMVGKVGMVYQSMGGPTPIPLHRARYRLLREFLERHGAKVGRAALAPPARLAGARAGVTTYGKNTFAFTSTAGSFVAITTLVVDKELQYDEPSLEVTCPENCNLCLETCPTGSLYEALRMDPRRCIAYNTYNAPGSWFGGTQRVLPPDIRDRMDTWIYGCDVCQQVCPRNQAKLKAELPPNAYLEHLAADFTLENVVDMTDEHFSRLYALLNTVDNKRYLQRNAAVALGNKGDREAVPALARAMESPDEALRGHAAWALGKIGGAKARTILESSLARESSEYVSDEISAALAR